MTDEAGTGAAGNTATDEAVPEPAEVARQRTDGVGAPSPAAHVTEPEAVAIPPETPETPTPASGDGTPQAAPADDAEPTLTGSTDAVNDDPVTADAEGDAEPDASPVPAETTAEAVDVAAADTDTATAQEGPVPQDGGGEAPEPAQAHSDAPEAPEAAEAHETAEGDAGADAETAQAPASAPAPDHRALLARYLAATTSPTEPTTPAAAVVVEEPAAAEPGTTRTRPAPPPGEDAAEPDVAGQGQRPVWITEPRLKPEADTAPAPDGAPRWARPVWEDPQAPKAPEQQPPAPTAAVPPAVPATPTWMDTPEPTDQPPPAKGRRIARTALAIAGATTAAAVVLAGIITLLVVSSHRSSPGDPFAGSGATVAATAPQGGTASATPAPAATAPSAVASPLTQLTNSGFQQGHCYSWDQDKTSDEAVDVPCEKPHLLEVVSDRVFPVAAPTPDYPSVSDWQDAAFQICVEPAQDYLGHVLDPYGRFRAAIIPPTQDEWARGDRDAYCGVAVNDPTVPAAQKDTGRYTPFSGEIKGADQSYVFPSGTCLSLDSANTVAPVSCDTPHEALAVAVATIPDPSDGSTPSATEITQQAKTLCLAAARQELGASYTPTSGTELQSTGIPEESWAAGTRRVSCIVTYENADGSARQVTGNSPTS